MKKFKKYKFKTFKALENFFEKKKTPTKIIDPKLLVKLLCLEEKGCITLIRKSRANIKSLDKSGAKEFLVIMIMIFIIGVHNIWITNIKSKSKS